MKAGELRAHLNHLVLVGQNEDGELEWVGTAQKWEQVYSEIYEV